MPSFKRILFPVDFSERCRGAARYAVAMAERFEAELLLLHVVETPVARPSDLDFGALAFASDSEAHIEDAAAMLQQFVDVAAERRVERGDPARTILRVAHEISADLIMMPTHGYGAFRRFILGSV